ncbi:hypothetical protein CkaCkLH20_12269 [Colletotrichum karsti]|uniref:Heterokaryon incompatibility domain-containing protein n=1 Tax=Colletotrichum karsti TaxID=1095194 RepID=A0A9P6HTB0_9PEZI|nr:uncharacterized protein CkaCkLH20_12269 [Colletotrichum karsti]KAF9870183.1 hypothetical protein CkaCkLH20_12269 [Colletotrichum karsti]
MQTQPQDTMSAYQNEAVGEYQLRIFFPCPAERFDDDLYGRPLSHDLEPSSKSDSRAYEALSYLWGSPKSPKQTLTPLEKSAPGALDGSNAQAVGTLQIGQNLVDALRNFRYKEKHRTLWIDAISIDQGNTEER